MRATVRKYRQYGATLVELVVSIVVISVGLAGILVVMDRSARSSADPIIQHQAVAIAEAYLEEILSKDFADPDGGETGGPEPGETRATFDDINDYHNLTDTGARNQNDELIPGLEQYTVEVQVPAEPLNGAPALRAQVTVTPPFGSPLVLSGFRTNY